MRWSSASQREAYSTCTAACAPRCTSHPSATSAFFLVFVHLHLPLFRFFSPLYGLRRLSTGEAPLPHPLKLESRCTTAPLFFVVTRLNTVHHIVPLLRAYKCFVFPYSPLDLVFWYLSSASRLKTKAQSDPNRSIDPTQMEKSPQLGCCQKLDVFLSD